MAILEFVGLLIIVYLLTQIFLPLCFPRELEMNWLFKKKKPLVNKTTSEEIDDILKQKEALKDSSKKLLTKSEEELDVAQKNRDLVKKNIK